MNNSDSLVFAQLFTEAYTKCFGQPLEQPLTETESKLFCNHVFELTGLSVGWKSVKNYSFFIVGNTSAKTENPSVATLDTLARYVLGAPYCTEIQRKNNESHYPYWFLYKGKSNRLSSAPPGVTWRHYVLMAMGISAVLILFIFWLNIKLDTDGQFTDNFNSVSEIALLKNGWFVKNPDPANWNKRSVTPGQLTLFTLKGDNWPSPPNQQNIKDLLLRPVSYDCFTAEVHLFNFVPQQEWQQAGLLLMEDTTLTSKSIRLSIAFNDNFGGYRKPKEVLIQAISSLGNGFGKPEEIAHAPILYLDSATANPRLSKGIQNSALRIEKQGKKFRFLYAGGENENGAFREIASREFDIQPRYIGLFAIKGFKDSTATIPAHFTFFRIADDHCK